MLEFYIILKQKNWKKVWSSYSRVRMKIEKKIR